MKDEQNYVKMGKSSLHWNDVAPLLNTDKSASPTEKWLTDETIDGQLHNIVEQHGVTDSVAIISSTTFMKWKVIYFYLYKFVFRNYFIIGLQEEN